jgi:DNA invertase Pin-like site-specific DNA recombinase
MRVGIYARVSTLIGQSPEMQLTELREYASRRGWEIFSEYVDSGISGSRESRPELNRLMSDAHQRARSMQCLSGRSIDSAGA